MAPKGYPVILAKRSRELVDAGWSRADTRRILAKEFGIAPHERTIKRWVNDDFAERRREQQRKKPWEEPYSRLQELRDLGLSHNAIATLLSHEHGVEVSENQVRGIASGQVTQNTIQRVLVPSGAEA